MKEWFDQQIASGFSDLAGLSITATIPLKDRLINEALSELLQSASAPNPPAATPALDFRSLAPLIKKAEVRAVEGAVVVDIIVRA